ncbi:unnamed protein product [Toxocara canis]|uniref:Glyco_hydro_38C domain-containing protein n=1 Tax=Toxocara canis TaxID=6265 RepID=A0A183U3R1_TOXCA|nr:unnamed protein product [Toxocara canis]
MIQSANVSPAKFNLSFLLENAFQMFVFELRNDENGVHVQRANRLAITTQQPNAMAITDGKCTISASEVCVLIAK